LSWGAAGREMKRLGKIRKDAMLRYALACRDAMLRYALCCNVIVHGESYNFLSAARLFLAKMFAPCGRPAQAKIPRLSTLSTPPARFQRPPGPLRGPHILNR